MGISHAINRVTQFLQEYYEEHGTEGYVLQMNLKNYFASIPHEPLKEMIRKKFTDEKIIKLTESFIDAFADEKMMEVQKQKEAAMLYGDEYARGLGLGSEICQGCAVAYPDPVDHWCGRRYCGSDRMRDIWMIHSSFTRIRNA